MKPHGIDVCGDPRNAFDESRGVFAGGQAERRPGQSAGSWSMWSRFHCEVLAPSPFTSESPEVPGLSSAGPSAVGVCREALKPCDREQRA